MTLTPGTYPVELETAVATRDGSLAHVRPVRPEDAERLLTFPRALPDEDRRLRFFSLGGDLARTAHDEANVDYVSSLGLLATVGSDERVVGHALYAPCGEGRAEVAFAIAHHFQGRGLATILLGQLAGAAAANGIEMFQALVLPENQKMLEVLRESGFPLKFQHEWGTVEVTFPTSLTHDALARFEQREELASANALRRVLYPRSVAVIGASRDPRSVGAAVVRNLVAGGFRGPVYPVNPAATIIQDLPSYPRLEAIPGPVDLAVIAVPAARVVEVAEECGRKGVQALVVLTAGFREVGGDGVLRQTELMRVCRPRGGRGGPMGATLATCRTTATSEGQPLAGGELPLPLIAPGARAVVQIPEWHPVGEQYVAYIRPLENGGHADVRWLELTGEPGPGVRIGLDRPRQVSVLHYRDDGLGNDDVRRRPGCLPRDDCAPRCRASRPGHRQLWPGHAARVPDSTWPLALDVVARAAGLIGTRLVRGLPETAKWLPRLRSCKSART